jgi:hypothetical protein
MLGWEKEKDMQENAPLIRFAVAGAISLVAIFSLCWIGAVVWPGAFTHSFITLFTPAPITSWLALGQGLCSALLFGFTAGAIVAWSYNLSAWLGRKPT